MSIFIFQLWRFEFCAWFSWIEDAVFIEFLPIVAATYEPDGLHFSLEWLTFGVEFSFNI